MGVKSTGPDQNGRGEGDASMFGHGAVLGEGKPGSDSVQYHLRNEGQRDQWVEKMEEGGHNEQGYTKKEIKARGKCVGVKLIKKTKSSQKDRKTMVKRWGRGKGDSQKTGPSEAH